MLRTIFGDGEEVFRDAGYRILEMASRFLEDDKEDFGNSREIVSRWE